MGRYSGPFPEARRPSPGPDSPTSPEGRGASWKQNRSGNTRHFHQPSGDAVDAEGQSCHYIVTSPAGGRGRGLSRGRGHAGVMFRVNPPTLGIPLPGLTDRPLPKGDVPPGNRIEAETRHIFISAGLG